MQTPVLLVATATRWLAAARMPRSLAKSGFEVSLLIPKGSVAEKSRYVAKIGYLPDNATPSEWIFAFAAAATATSPRLVLPCDDSALRLMMMLAVSPPPAMNPAMQLRLAALIVESLGDPAFYRTSIDKTLVCPAAEALGVRVPAHKVVSKLAEAEPFIAAHGFPIVVKQGYSTAGDGVAICRDLRELEREFARLSQRPVLSFNDNTPGRLLLQVYIPGRCHFYTAAAWKGSVVSGVAVEKLEGEPMGPTSVVRYFRSPQMHDLTERLTRGFNMSGIFSPEFIVHEDSGEAYLLEVNRRMSHGTHRGTFMRVDVCTALHAAINGSPSPTRTELDDGEEHRCAHFPAEWVRDADSHWLRECPVDLPWDEPELLQALFEDGLHRLRGSR